jgi:polysaccharide deacetylase 2 family uncharacterized protein YibQ
MFRLLWRLAVLVGLLACLGVLGWWLVHRVPGPGEAVGPSNSPAPSQVATAAEPAAGGPTPVAAGPRLAICIDDWGYLAAPVERLRTGLRFPMTTSILPMLPHSVDSAEASFAAGHEVILHCPMQSVHNVGREKNTLLTTMSASECRAMLEAEWAAVPHLTGLNNHEGSAASADRALMDVVAGFLKEHNAFFLDSVTTPKSVIPNAAKAAGVPWARRRVFLDNDESAAAVAAQFRIALALAKKNGSCIAIGHPHPRTLKVLERLAPEAAAQGVTLVTVGALVHP